LSVNLIVSSYEVPSSIEIEFDLHFIQDDVPLAMVPAMVFFAVPGVFGCVSVCVVGLCSWFELVEHMCEVGVGADERCKCKLHNEVEAQLMLRLQQA